MKLLVTGAWDCTERQLNEIRALGHNVFFLKQEKDELPCGAEEIEGVICNGLFLYHKIEEFKSLRFIQLTSAGFDRVPLDYVKEHNIEIFNARGVYSIPMAEFAISGVLQLYKQNGFFYENQKLHKWEKHRDLLELFGKTVLIVGCGSVGTECAKRFSAFGCKVLGIDAFPYKNDFFDEMSGLDSLDDILTRSDVVVLTLPLTAETKGLFNAFRFNKMKGKAVLVNISRGAIIDETSLLKAVDEKLYGAVLDVFEEEPLKADNPLWQKRNVIITPHNSFVGEGNGERLFNVVYRNLRS